MGSIERQTLADLGRLHLFAWRVRGHRHGPLPDGLGLEFKDILEQYDMRQTNSSPYRQVRGIAIAIMNKLEHDIKILDRHVPVGYTVTHGKITAVECTCGEYTKYRVPLKLLDDFQCPKEHQYEINRRRASN